MTGPISKPRPLVIVCANQAWNLVNFRTGLIRAMQAQGFAVLAVAPDEPAMAERLRAIGCTFEPVAIDAMGLSPLRDAVTFWNFLRIVRRHRPVAWLSWTIKPNVYGSLAAGWCAVPAFPNVSGLGTAFIRRNLLTLLAKLLYRTGFRKAFAVFFQNSDDRDLFVGEAIVGKTQARLLPGSGIDPGDWAAPSSGRPSPRQFLMLARVVADKGVREYADAARELRRKWPDARFGLMGPLDVANRTAIPVEEVRAWEAEGTLEYIAPVDDVRPAIAAADFIVLPSYREGLSRVLLEAAALGRPIVTTDVPGCRDIVRDGENGYLCVARSASSLLAALDRAARTNDADWQCMAKAGIARVHAEFSQDRVSSLYLETMREAGVPMPEAH